MRRLRGARTWAWSAVITAGLLAIASWRTLPGVVPGRLVLAGTWLVATVVVHLLLHNRWMRALDERWRAVLAARRSRGRSVDPRAAAPPRPSTAAPRRPGADIAPAERGPAHATHRPGGRLATVLPSRRSAELPEPAVIVPTSVPALPPLRPVGPVGVGARYHHPARLARSRPRAGRAA